ncbi:hypothetical protein FV222_18010 [Methylobacterium sp. WL103]|uniref:SCO family protein n=1 Tax=unclassified Methylobacterium TaxID=2615210 RepID=UPI0011C7DFEF|nr:MULTISPECIES: SCO family protein [unclassified Methylobacterium]TXM72378.1 hypothetical protein FV226_12660 [Methylobacterium sp. WL12]TXM96495.1 hypothetical protein FV222_18010 [Methylobacterium sp. WL103]
MRGVLSRGGLATRLLRRVLPVLGAGLLAAGATSSAPGGRNDALRPETALSDLLWSGDPVAAPRIDQSGRVLAPSSLRDRVVVLSFVSTDCLITCVARTLALADLTRDLPPDVRARTVVLAASVAPDRDDVAALRRFAEGLRIDAGKLRLVTGTAAATASVIAALRYPADRLPEPPPTVLVFDRRGQIAMTYGGDPLDVPRLRRDIGVLHSLEDGVGHPPRPAASAAP